MKVLAIDYGTKRLGLAWADTNLDVILPYGTIVVPVTTKGSASIVKKIVELIKREPIDCIVIGWPVGLGGHENRMTGLVKELAFELPKHISTPVEFFDERFTSQAADALGSAGASRDERAAMVILEGYLETLKH